MPPRIGHKTDADFGAISAFFTLQKAFGFVRIGTCLECSVFFTETEDKKGKFVMIYTTEVQHMCPVAKGAYHGPAPIPEEGKWVQAKEIKDISGFTHGILSLIHI